MSIPVTRAGASCLDYTRRDRMRDSHVDQARVTQTMFTHIPLSRVGRHGAQPAMGPGSFFSVATGCLPLSIERLRCAWAKIAGVLTVAAAQMAKDHPIRHGRRSGRWPHDAAPSSVPCRYLLCVPRLKEGVDDRVGTGGPRLEVVRDGSARQFTRRSGPRVARPMDAGSAVSPRFPDLTVCGNMGSIAPHSAMQRKVRTQEFFARNPIFSLDLAARDLAPAGGRAGTVARLKHHLSTGRLKLVGRGLYAVVPHGRTPESVRPDPFLLMAAARSDAVFSHHAALELLGVAHSVWNECTAYTHSRRRPLSTGGTTLRFLEAPSVMETASGGALGTRRVERRGQLLETTGPERTLVEGFRRPHLVGGFEELLRSASGFATLDFALLAEVLQRYGVANLWAATGWFLERTRERFHVPEGVLERHAGHVPVSPQYLERGRRGGELLRRWNLIVPGELLRPGEPDER